MYAQLLELDQISHTQSMVAKRGRTNRANVHYPYMKKFQQFWLQLDIILKKNKKKKKKKTKTKNSDSRVWGTVCGSRFVLALA